MRDVWSLVRHPGSLADALGCDEANPKGLTVVPMLQPTLGLSDLVPRAIVPTRMVRVTAAAVAGQLSFVEVQAGAGEVRIIVATFSIASVAVGWVATPSGTAIAATDGSQLDAARPVTAQIRTGANAATGLSANPYRKSGAPVGTEPPHPVTGAQWPPLVPGGSSLRFEGIAVNTALVMDLLVEERAANLGRVVGG